MPYSEFLSAYAEMSESAMGAFYQWVYALPEQRNERYAAWLELEAKLDQLRLTTVDYGA